MIATLWHEYKIVLLHVYEEHSEMGVPGELKIRECATVELSYLLCVGRKDCIILIECVYLSVSCWAVPAVLQWMRHWRMFPEAWPAE